MNARGKKTVTFWIALFGLLTALCGLLQTMWSTAPWWVGEKATAVAPPPPHMVPMAGENDPPVVEQMSDEEVSSVPVGPIILGIGIVVAGGALIVRRRFRDA